MARLRNTVNPPDPGELRERAVRAMHTFEQRVRDARTCLASSCRRRITRCAPASTTSCSTRPGAAPACGTPTRWSRPSTREPSPANASSSCSTQMRQNPGRYLPVIELMYLCMSLGFQGQYRLSPRGPAELDRLREETYAVIVRQRQAPEPELSPHWKGVAAPYRGVAHVGPGLGRGQPGPGRARRPLRVVLDGLNAASDDLFARMQAVPPPRMPEIVRTAPVRPPPPQRRAGRGPPAARVPRARGRAGSGRRSTASRPTRSCASGIAGCSPRAARRSTRASCRCWTGIGAALKEEPGTIEVIGYTDNQPIRTVQFPSNFQLSAARAEAARVGPRARARRSGADLGGRARRCRSDERANATPEGREQNRRIEIVLHRPG